MSNSNCELCTFQARCGRSDIFLYAATPILRDIVEKHLRRLGAPFTLSGELFAIPEKSHAVIRQLQQELSAAERSDLRVSRARGSALMAAPTLDAWSEASDTSWFEDAIRRDAFTTCFQPIVDRSGERVFAYECLIRLFGERAYSGGEIIEAAVSRGSVHLFDSYARRLAIRSAGTQYRGGAKAFVNFMPSSIYDPAYCMRSTLEELRGTDMTPADVVFEVVESEHIADSRHLRKICDFYRSENFGFALDDVGSGSSSLQMICDLKPDFIKIDKSLTSRIGEPMYMAAIEKLVEFAHQFGVQVVAEGIENERMAEQITRAHVDFMQGYYFGKPSQRMAGTSALEPAKVA